MVNLAEKKVNVASEASTSGHFAVGAENVVVLDKVTETSWIEGRSRLVTQNHTELKQEESCMITIQNVYNPFSKMFQKAKD
jgi:hypothetical protein